MPAPKKKRRLPNTKPVQQMRMDADGKIEMRPAAPPREGAEWGDDDYIDQLYWEPGYDHFQRIRKSPGAKSDPGLRDAPENIQRRTGPKRKRLNSGTKRRLPSLLA